MVKYSREEILKKIQENTVDLDNSKTVLRVSKQFKFSSAHKLPNYDGLCANLHGHEWVVEVEVKGNINEDTGMLVDFTYLKKIVNEKVIKIFDHHYLNNELHNPTAENISCTIFMMLADYIKGINRISVWETASSRCDFIVDDNR